MNYRFGARLILLALALALHGFGQGSLSPTQKAETGAITTLGQFNGGFWKSLDAQGKKLFAPAP